MSLAALFQTLFSVFSDSGGCASRFEFEKTRRKAEKKAEKTLSTAP